jgi:hypothetical protein
MKPTKRKPLSATQHGGFLSSAQRKFEIYGEMLNFIVKCKI